MLREIVKSGNIDGKNNKRGSLTMTAIFTILIFSLYGILLYARSASSYIRQTKSIENIQTVYSQDVQNAVRIANKMEQSEESVEEPLDLKAHLVDGRTLAGRMKELAGTSDHYAQNDVVTAIKKATNEQYEAIKDSLTSKNFIHSDSSDHEVSLWLDGTTIYFHSETDVIHMSDNMERAFCKFSNLEDISGLQYFDTSGVTNMNRMFQNCWKIKDLSPLSNWDVSNVTDMTFMFGSTETNIAMAINDLTPLADWDVSKVTSFEQTFKVCSSVTTLEPIKNWNVSSSLNFKQMFNRAGLTSAMDIIDWDVRNATTFDMMLANMPTLPNSKRPIFTLRSGSWNNSGTYIPN